MLRSLVRRLLADQPESVDDYLGVVVPLEEAHLHSHSARIGRCEFEERPGREDDDEDEEDGKDQGESTGMLEMDAAEYTIEGLRKEVRRGGRGQWTEYECELLLFCLGWCGCVADEGSEIEAGEQGDPGHWDGAIQLAAVYPLRLWMVCG